VIASQDSAVVDGLSLCVWYKQSSCAICSGSSFAPKILSFLAACNDNDASTCCDTRAAGFCQRVIHSGFRSWSRCRPHNQLLDARSRLQLELQMRTRKVEAGSQHRRSQARPWSALPRSQPNALNGRCVPERRRHCPSKRAAARTSEDCRPPSLQLCHPESARP